MRTRSLCGLALALLVAGSSMTVATERAEAHGYRGWGWGIAAGIATGVILNQMYRAPYYRSYYYRPYYGYGYGGYPAYYYDDDYDGAPYYYRPYRVYRPYRYYRPYAY